MDKAIEAIKQVIETVEDNVPDGHAKTQAMNHLIGAALWVGADLVLKRKQAQGE